MAHAAQTSAHRIHRITLDFEDAATLALALEHIGDRDAPVMLTGGTVITGGEAHPLWEGYHASLSRAEGEVAAKVHGGPAPMTASDLIRTVREIAAAAPDRINAGPREYRDENNAPVLAYDWKDEVKSTLAQRDWLHHVQKKQDAGKPWAEAVSRTDHQMGPIG